MKITRVAAMALFAALGMAGAAEKWNSKRMAAKLGKVDEMIDKDTKLEDKAADATLTEVLKNIAEGKEFEVTEDAAPAAAPAAPAAAAPTGKAAAAAKGKKAPATPAAAPAAAPATGDTVPITQALAEGQAAVAAAAPAPAGKKKKEAATKPAAAPKTPGVRETKTRPYLAGLIIARHGVETGITDAMAEELNKEYGKANTSESMNALKWSWHACRGFAEGLKAKK
jgi:hypothetical protein